LMREKCFGGVVPVAQVERLPRANSSLHHTPKHSSYAPLPLSLSPPGVRRMVYCRAVRLTESPLRRWLTSLSCRCFVSMD
ncbi:TPA: hypothetical protein ACH1NH_004375, partial [Enterobacter hormaechei]